MTEKSFITGDPVQTVQQPFRFGRVTRAFLYAPSLIYVKLVGNIHETAFCPDELRICKCAVRIPKGVSQCQK